MSAYTPDPAQERAPNRQNLYTDPPAPEVLDRLLAETDDDPTLDLNGLDPDIGQRMGVRFVVCTQVDGYAEQAAGLLHDVDYALLDTSSAGSGHGKGLRDVARNLAFSGTKLYVGTNDKTGVSYSSFGKIHLGLHDIDPVVEAFVGSPAYQQRTTKPVVRTIGLSLTDYMPEKDNVTLEGTRGRIEMLVRQYESEVFTETNDELLERLGKIFQETAYELVAMEPQLRTDISTIIANAVVRHPGKEKTFGVVLDARNYEVASGMLAYSGLFRSLEIQYAPFMGTSSLGHLPSAEDKAERKAARRSDRTPPTSALKRVLLTSYVEEAFLDELGDEEKAIRLTRRFESSLADEQVHDLLEIVDSTKSDPLFPIPFRRRSEPLRRRNKVLKRVWEHPSIAVLRQK